MDKQIQSQAARLDETDKNQFVWAVRDMSARPQVDEMR